MSFISNGNLLKEFTVDFQPRILDLLFHLSSYFDKKLAFKLYRWEYNMNDCDWIKLTWSVKYNSDQIRLITDNYSSWTKELYDGTWRNMELILILWYKVCMGHYHWVVLSAVICAMLWGNLPKYCVTICSLCSHFNICAEVPVSHNCGYKTLWHYLLCLSQERYLQHKKRIFVYYKCC